MPCSIGNPLLNQNHITDKNNSPYLDPHIFPPHSSNMVLSENHRHLEHRSHWRPNFSQWLQLFLELWQAIEHGGRNGHLQGCHCLCIFRERFWVTTVTSSSRWGELFAWSKHPALLSVFINFSSALQSNETSLFFFSCRPVACSGCFQLSCAV